MARNNTNNKLKNKSLWILAVICLLCFSMFFFVACGDNTTDNDDETTYTKTETDVGDITNSTFEFGSIGLDLDDYPQTSPSGWSKSVDNSAKSVSVKSGVVSIEAWDDVLKNLYDNSAFLSYVENNFGFDSEKEENDVKAADNTLSSDEIKEKVKDAFATFLTNDTEGKMKAPVAPVSTSKKLYMLNNYVSDAIYGSAQKVTSSSTVNLEKDSVYKISVWVNTYNLDYMKTGKGGANIRLINNFNGTAQAPFGIYGIDTQGIWQEYSLYVKTDVDKDCSIQLVLGLGFGNGTSSIVSDYTEGTVLFDEISIEKIEETTIPVSANETVFDYERSTENKNYLKATTQEFVYNMKLTDALDSHATAYINNTNLNIIFNTHEFTETTNGITSETILGSTNSNKGTLTPDNNNLRVENISNASVTLSSSIFTLPAESYVYYSFKIENNLGKFDKNGITVYMYDVEKPSSNVTLIGNYATVGEDTLCSFIIKNEFDTARQYSLKLVIGPSAIKDLKNADDFSSGSVLFKDFYQTSGSIYEHINNDPFMAETDNYDYYSLFSATASKTVSLLGSSTQVPEEEKDPTFTFNVSSTDLNTIKETTANVKNYKGVDADSQYIKEESNNFVVNERTGIRGDDNGFAGLINTKYLSSYSDLYLKNNTTSTPDLQASDITNALGHNGEDNIQPLMIYNKNASSYGYFGNSNTISANSYAKISVKVRVVGDAVGYVYLVNTTGVNKNVLVLDNFTVNTDGYDYKTTNTKVENKQLYFAINKDMLNSDGWCEVTFYVATGATAKSFRLEMWNGARDGATNSQGFVFFDSPVITTSGAFTEPTAWIEMYTTGVLAGLRDEVTESAMHQRELDAIEEKFNNEQSSADTKVSYDAKYVWVKGENFVYAVYNTIDPVAVDPYASETEDEESANGGCTAETDPSTFWLSFSSILLGAVLVLAIIMLFVKNIKRRHKRNEKDAKSHYNVTSRYNKKNKPSKPKKQEFDDYEEEVEEPVTPAEEVVEEQPIEETETPDDYVYGDVQDFGEDEKNDNE